MRGFYDSHMACEGVGIKAIHGIEFYVSNDMHRKGLTEDEKNEITKGLKPNERKAAIKKYESEHGIRDRWHLTVWAKNNEGLKNLFRLSTASYVDGFYYKPRIDLDALIEHGDGLVVGTGCTSSVIYDMVCAGKKRQALEIADRLRDKFGEDLWIEVQPHDIGDQITANRFAMELKERWGKNARFIATQDAHYVWEGDHIHHEVLLCIGTNDYMSNPERFKFDGNDFFLKSRKQMYQAFAKRHGYMGKRNIRAALDGTMEFNETIATKLNIDWHAALLPEMELPGKFNNEWDYLKDLCFQGWTWREIPRRAAILARKRGVSTAHMKRVYKERLVHELSSISAQKFVSYFLIVHDIYNWARGQKIMCGPGRGSVAGSLVAYLIGLTSVDPIEHDLIFERFLNPERVDMPDCFPPGTLIQTSDGKKDIQSVRPGELVATSDGWRGVKAVHAKKYCGDLLEFDLG
jgi:DNA polymerase-3 subunit alpha